MGNNLLKKGLKFMMELIHGKCAQGQFPGLYVTCGYEGERSLSPDDEVLGLTSGDVHVMTEGLSKSWNQTWSDIADWGNSLVDGGKSREAEPSTRKEEIKQRLAANQKEGSTVLGMSKGDVTSAFKPW